jgi:hypothetical protein
MRNKLAHEQNSLDFKNADIIEVLPDTTLEGFIQKINVTLSISQMLDDTKAIFSNIVFMRIRNKIILSSDDIWKVHYWD